MQPEHEASSASEAARGAEGGSSDAQFEGRGGRSSSQGSAWTRRCRPCAREQRWRGAGWLEPIGGDPGRWLSNRQTEIRQNKGGVIP